MTEIFENYLDTIDRHLKPLPTSERIDIVKEIKGSILEMENENLTQEQIMQRLGNPKELAKAYLGDLLSTGAEFSWNRFLTICAYYSVVGISGLVIIPTLAIIAPVFIACAIIVPLLGIAKLINYLLHLGIPYFESVRFQLGPHVLGPISALLVSIVTGVILYLIGYGSWKLLLGYCRKVSKAKKKLSI